MIGFSPGSDLRRLSRTLATCFIVGIVVGLAACLFHAALQGMTTLFMDRLIHYSTPRPYGEAVVAAGSDGPFRRWLLLVFPALGGLPCGVLVPGFAPRAA